MMFAIRVIAVPVSALAVTMALFATPALAQSQGVQRIPVSSILDRLDRLETGLATMRLSPGGAGDEMTTRMDQIELEIRRLTGLVERLEYEATRRAEDADKRALDMETRLQALESRKPDPFVATPAPTLPLAQLSAPLPASPALTLGVGPAVALGGPRQLDTPPDLSALPVQPAPLLPVGRTGGGVAFAGASVPSTPETPLADPVAAPPVQAGLPTAVGGPSAGDAQARYDEALRLLNVGSFDAAGAALETLVADHPQDAVSGSAKYWLGDMHLRLGRFNEAAKAFLESFRGWPEGPKAPDSLLKLGMTLAGLGQKEEACLTFSEFPSRYPDASQSLLQRAEIESRRTQCGG